MGKTNQGMQLLKDWKSEIQQNEVPQRLKP